MDEPTDADIGSIVPLNAAEEALIFLIPYEYKVKASRVPTTETKRIRKIARGIAPGLRDFAKLKIGSMPVGILTRAAKKNPQETTAMEPYFLTSGDEITVYTAALNAHINPTINAASEILSVESGLIETVRKTIPVSDKINPKSRGNENLIFLIVSSKITTIGKYKN